jgi:serine/threonine protein kinase
MHQFYITHNDIKPDNIVYSPTYKKFVFIDYGLS